MAVKIVVPDMGESVARATVGRWLRKQGESVGAGETVVEIETDKVDLEVGAERGGIVARIERKQGDEVKSGDLLGLIAESAGEMAATLPLPPRPPPMAIPIVSQKPRAAAIAPPASVPGPHMEDAKVSAAARRATPKQEIDSGAAPPMPNGRAERIKGESSPSRVPTLSREEPAVVILPDAPPAAPSSIRAEREERLPLSRRQRVLAQRWAQSQPTTPMFTTIDEINLHAIIEIRKRRKESFREQYGVGLGLVSFLIKATIGALKSQPRLNAELQGDELVVKHYYDIGIAISAPGGLVVPVLRNVERMSFAEIERGLKTFAKQAADGTLAPDESSAPTFTVANAGAIGSLLSTPVLNLPQAGILALHKIEERPVAREGQVIIQPMMYAALTYDPRIVQGREAVQFLECFKRFIEDPETLLFS